MALGFLLLTGLLAFGTYWTTKYLITAAEQSAASATTTTTTSPIDDSILRMMFNKTD